MCTISLFLCPGTGTILDAQVGPVTSTTDPASAIDLRPTAPGPSSTTSETPAGPDYLNWQHATDGWFGLRPKLEDHGIDFSAWLTADWAKNFSGGISTKGYNFGQLFNASITFDTQKLVHWPGGKVFILFQNEAGEFATADVGDIQVVDNLTADGRTQLAELWYEQSLFDDKLRVRAGKINANGDFASTDNGINFLQSSMGISPTILNIPKYPDPAMGLQIWTEPNKNVYAGAGVFDGALHDGISTGDLGPATLFGKPSDLFMIGEGGLKWELASDTLPGRAGVGVWHHTGTFDRFDGGVEKGTTGFYFLADQTVFRKHPADKNDNQGIGIFFQYGWADPEVSRIEHHIGAGLQWTGAIPTRDNDIFGLGASCALLTNRPAAGFDESAETAIELFYRLQLVPWMSIQPDLQYVVNPGGISSRENALVGLLRVVIDF